jgi:hypothetical protein
MSFVLLTHASGQRYLERSAQHKSGFVGFEEKFFINHGIRIIQKHADAMGCNPTRRFYELGFIVIATLRTE